MPASQPHVAPPQHANPLLTSPPRARTTPGPAPRAGQPLPVAARRKHFQAPKNRASVAFGPQHVWTFHLWQARGRDVWRVLGDVLAHRPVPFRPAHTHVPSYSRVSIHSLSLSRNDLSVALFIFIIQFFALTFYKLCVNIFYT